MRGIKSVVFKEQMRLDKMYPVTTQHMADTIQDWICNKMKWEKYKIQFLRKISGRTGRCLGKNFKYRKLIVMYSNGEGAGVLLHEIAHIKEYNHKPQFWFLLASLIKQFETEFIPFMGIKPIEIQQSKNIIDFIAPTEEAPMKQEDKMSYIMEILEEHIKNNTIKMLHIGQTLLDEGMNNRENIQTVVSMLKVKGIRIQ